MYIQYNTIGQTNWNASSRVSSSRALAKSAALPRARERARETEKTSVAFLRISRAECARLSHLVFSAARRGLLLPGIGPLTFSLSLSFSVSVLPPRLERNYSRVSIRIIYGTRGSLSHRPLFESLFFAFDRPALRFFRLFIHVCVCVCDRRRDDCRVFFSRLFGCTYVCVVDCFFFFVHGCSNEW